MTPHALICIYIHEQFHDKEICYLTLKSKVSLWLFIHVTMSCPNPTHSFQEWRVEIPLTVTHVCACPKPGHGFPTSYVVVFLCSVTVSSVKMRGLSLFLLILVDWWLFKLSFHDTKYESCMIKINFLILWSKIKVTVVTSLL